jgi:hypothetical protein
VRWLTTPLLPDDYLALFNPLWCGRELRGRVVAIHRETADAATLVIRSSHGWIPSQPRLDWAQAGAVGSHRCRYRGVRHWRTYSLPGPPGRPDGHITITVKAAPQRFVSRYLVGHAAPARSLRWPDRAASSSSQSRRRRVCCSPDGRQRHHARARDAVRPPDRPGHAGRRGSPGCLPLALRRAEMPSAAGCPMWSCCTRYPRQNLIFGEELHALAARFANLRL